jgi:hypothetical protein
LGRRLQLAFLPALLILVALLLTGAKAPDATIIVDWEVDGQGAPLVRGEIITNQFNNGPGLGFNVSVVSNGSEDAAVIFDSATPSLPLGDDPDLGTPNNQYEITGGVPCVTICGPGVSNGSGDAGASNDSPEGNVLIIQENAGQDANGNYVTPDDNWNGGVVTITFNGPIIPLTMSFLDQEIAEAVEVQGSLNGNPLGAPIGVSGLGDNSREQLDISAIGPVDTLVVTFSGSGAISSFRYEDTTVSAISLQSFNPVNADSMGLLVMAAFGLLVIATMGFYLQSHVARREV